MFPVFFLVESFFASFSPDSSLIPSAPPLEADSLICATPADERNLEIPSGVLVAEAVFLSPPEPSMVALPSAPSYSSKESISTKGRNYTFSYPDDWLEMYKLISNRRSVNTVREVTINLPEQSFFWITCSPFFLLSILV
jgi:hypothetical protein